MVTEVHRKEMAEHTNRKIEEKGKITGMKKTNNKNNNRTEEKKENNKKEGDNK